VSRGVPAGGQFAPNLTAESSGVELIDDVDQGDTWCEPARRDQGRPAGFSAFEVELVVEAARRSGHFWARRYGSDADDLTSETLLAWWAAMSRKSDNQEVVDVRHYINRTVRNLATHAIAGATRAEDRQAYKRYQSWWERFCQEHGRQPTVDECDAMAVAIRDAQPERRRACPDFHRRPRTVFIDDASRLGLSVPALVTSTVTEFPPRMEAVASLAEARGRENLEAARRQVWDAMAERFGGPMVQQAAFDDHHAAAHRKVIRAVGGAEAAGRRWMSGTCSDEEAVALFAPFGAVDEDSRDRVVGVMLAVPAHADDLWDAAVGAATTARANRAAG
jgi:DNA-directed RNA polymerase specialized sigma24 family protein